MYTKALLVSFSLICVCLADYNITCFDPRTHPFRPPPAPIARDCGVASQKLDQLIPRAIPRIMEYTFTRQDPALPPAIHLPLTGRSNGYGAPLGCEIVLDLRNGYQDAQITTNDFYGALTEITQRCFVDTEHGGIMYAGEAIVGSEKKISFTMQSVDIPPTGHRRNLSNSSEGHLEEV